MKAITLTCTAQSVRSPMCADAALWRAWAAQGGALPEQADAISCPVPALLRRRLTPFGRTALSALADLAPQPTEPIVFASSWGDIERSFALLSDLAADEDLSPMAFSSSVHNAVPAVACIWLKNHTACRAVAAGPLSASAALLESALALEVSESVLLLVAESAMPKLWNSPHQPDSAPCPLAWAARLQRASDAALFEIELRASAAHQHRSLSADMLEVLRFALDARSQLTQHDGQRGWTWTKRLPGA